MPEEATSSFIAKIGRFVYSTYLGYKVVNWVSYSSALPDTLQVLQMGYMQGIDVPVRMSAEIGRFV